MNTARNLAIIFAEGGNPRLRPLTNHLPTALVPVGGTPILDHQIQALRRGGVGTIHVVGGHRGVQVEQATRMYPNVNYVDAADFAASESQVGSLRAVPVPQPVPSCLLMRGDLIVDSGVIEAMLQTPEGEEAWLSVEDRSAGLFLAHGRRMAEMIDPAGAARDEDALFAALKTAIVPAGFRVEAPGTRAARVVTMEDLAGLLRRGLVAGSGPVDPSPLATTHPAGRAAPRAPETPVPAASAGSPATGPTILAGPVFRSQHR